MNVLMRFAGPLLAATLLLPGAALAQREGVNVGGTSGFASLVPATESEASASKQYKTRLAEAARPWRRGHPEVGPGLRGSHPAARSARDHSRAH